MRVFPLSLLLVLFSLPVSSASAWDLAVVTGLNFSRPSLNPDPPVGTTLSTKSALDIGALGSFSIGESYFFETGLIRHSRATVLTDAVSTTETRYSGWLIPLTLRFMRADFFGFGFGPYIGFPGSRTKTLTSYTGGGSAESNAKDENRKESEFGLHVNLRLAFPIYNASKLVIDGTYLFGFTDLNKSGTAEDKTLEFLFLVGLQIPIGGQTDAQSESPSASGPKIKNPETPSLAPEASPIPPSKSKKKKEKRK